MSKSIYLSFFAHPFPQLRFEDVLLTKANPPDQYAPFALPTVIVDDVPQCREKQLEIVRTSFRHCTGLDLMMDRLMHLGTVQVGRTSITQVFFCPFNPRNDLTIREQVIARRDSRTFWLPFGEAMMSPQTDSVTKLVLPLAATRCVGWTGRWMAKEKGWLLQ